MASLSVSLSLLMAPPLAASGLKGVTPLTQDTVFPLVISLDPAYALVNSPFIKYFVDYSDLDMSSISSRIGPTQSL